MNDHRSDPPTIRASIEVAASDLDALVETVTSTGTRVDVTRDGVRVVVIVPWEWYRFCQERHAIHEFAYWSSWDDNGEFDKTAHGAMLADLFDPRPAPLSETNADGAE